jgi:hypothetical protein
MQNSFAAAEKQPADGVLQYTKKSRLVNEPGWILMIAHL